MIEKSSLQQKNRIALIILDSTLEIAYKEYLVNEQNIGVAEFKNIADNRTLIQTEVLKTITMPTATVKKINFYYKLRCDLIHQRVTPAITDKQIEDYRKIVEEILDKMFGLQFNY